jgi:CDP-diacylglycerol--glycerol-3-phosphate 3-phosphatidyltransferase
MEGSIRSLSNALSLLRILLVAPVSLALISDTPGSRTVAMVLIVVAAMTDFLDGYVARKKGEVTELGKILDPVADKTAVGAVGLILALQERVPVWFVAAILARDLLIVAGGYYLKKKKSLLPQSNRLGKWTAGVLALTLFAAVAEGGAGGPLVPVLLTLSTAMLVFSSFSYGARFASALSAQHLTNP